MATQTVTLTAGHNYLVTSASAYTSGSAGIQSVSLSGTTLTISYYGEFDVVDVGMGSGTTIKVFVLTPDGMFAMDEYSPATLKRSALYTLANGKQDQHSTVTVSVATSAWNSSTKEATINVTGATSSNDIIVAPASASYLDYANAQIRAISQSSGTVTLKCETVPTSTISIVLVIL